MKHKRLKVTTLAAALALSMSAPSMAGVPAPGSGGGVPALTDEIAANSDTTVSILQSSVKNPNISYTVPLYVTMAVIANDSNVKTPDNYIISNTTEPETPGDPSSRPPIGVTNMSIEKLSSATYSTVDNAAVVEAGDATSIFLQIGGEDMPATAEADKVYAVNLKGTTLTTMKESTRVPAPIASQKKLDITGKVKSMARTDTKAAAQFRIKYTVSLLDASGQALGAVYAGDDRTAAGLPAWTTK